MEVKYTTLEQLLVSARTEALNKFNSLGKREGRLFGMNVYALDQVKLDEELQAVFGSTNRGVWVLENFTPEIPMAEKTWSDFEVTGLISFDGDIIVTSSLKLEQTIKKNITEAVEWIMGMSGPNKAICYNFGNDMNTFIWEQNFKSFIEE
jgi:hypothetical protein